MPHASALRTARPAHASTPRAPAPLRRSWYILFFQAPGLPELLSLAADCKFVEDALRAGPIAPRRPGIISDEDIERCAPRCRPSLLWRPVRPGPLSRLRLVKRAPLTISDKGVECCPLCFHLLNPCLRLGSDMRRIWPCTGPMLVSSLLEGTSASVEHAHTSKTGSLSP